MSIFKRKNLLVGITTCALFVSTGCIQNLANSNFSQTSSFNSKQINSESDGIVALKEVFDVYRKMKKFTFYHHNSCNLLQIKVQLQVLVL